MDARRPSEEIPDMPAPLSELPWSPDFVMQALEILAVCARDGEIVAFRPDCADSFVVGWPAGERPEQVASRALQALGLVPTVLHSTSWRHAGGEVVLTYLAVVAADSATPESWELAPVAHTELARGGATAPPTVIATDQVLEHALRHLCWLVKEDPEIGESLPGWTELLSGYVPEPFRSFGEPPR
jgi:hypothetical protein